MAKKKSILDLYKMKEANEQAVWVTAYDAPFASYAEKAGVEVILVGDSMAMVVYGLNTTVPITMDMCINHSIAVKRGAPNTYTIGDMPFGSYHGSTDEAVKNAVRFIKEADVDSVKLEGGVYVADKIRAIVRAGIVVFGHVGLTPQSSAAMGGFKAQGRTVQSAQAVIDDAIAVYQAGAKAMLLEGIPEKVSQFIHSIIPIPIYGIGAGAGLDGQALVLGDLLGMFDSFTPKFSKRYADIAGVATDAFSQFVGEVKQGKFPEEAHKYKLAADDAEFEAMFLQTRQKLAESGR